MAWWDKVISKLGGWWSIILIILILWMGTYTVSIESNAYFVNETDDNNNNTRRIEKFFYDQYDRVPVKNWGDNDLNQFTWGKWALILVAVVGYMLIIHNKSPQGSKTLEDAKFHTRKKLNERKGKDIDEFYILEEGFKPYRHTDDQQPYPKSIIVIAYVKFNDNAGDLQAGWHKIGYEYDPYNLSFKRIIRNPLTSGYEPVCPRCGKFPDEKDNSIEYLQKMKMKFGMGKK